MTGRRRCRARLLAAALGLAAVSVGACDRQQRPTSRMQLVAGGDPDVGKTRFARYGCVSCHTIPGVPGAHGKTGPSLGHWAGRRFVGGVVPNDPASLVRWIVDPRGVDPRTAMPNVGASESDARHMAAYLYTLQ
jgi:cytochrome c2